MPAPRSILAVAVAVVPACSMSEEPFVPQTYLKASNADAGDDFGRVLALSADGTTLAVGAFREDSPSRGINQSQDNQVADTTIGSFGAVYLFVRKGAGWSQEAYIKASNAEVDDWFGRSLAVSAEGNTLAVGAPGEDSGSSGDQNSNAAENSGAVYVFSRSAGSWSQVAYVKASRPAAGDSFGTSVALSGDGSLLVVGAPQVMAGTGTVYAFARGAAWTQTQQLPAPAVGSPGGFGASVAMALDGSTLAVGAPGEDVDTAAGAGAVRVFARAGGLWSGPVRVVASAPGTNDKFGSTLAISGDGTTLAAGAQREAGATDGAGTAPPIGAVHLFSRSDGSWRSEDHLALSSTDPGNFFGLAVALSADGRSLAVGAPVEGRAAADEPPDSCAPDLGGTVYRFAKSGATWGSRTRIQGSHTCKDDWFGQAVGLSSDGSILAVGANGEDSATHGIDQDQNDNTAHDAGAAYVLRY